MRPSAQACYDAAISLLLYGYQSRHLCITFQHNTTVPNGINGAEQHKQIITNMGFVAYSDASWNRQDELGQDSYGFVIYLAGGPVAYAAKRISVSCVSVAEAEYAAASYTSREMEFIRNVCTELGFTLRGKLVLCVDNSAAIQIAERHGVTARTTHFRATLHRLRAVGRGLRHPERD